MSNLPVEDLNTQASQLDLDAGTSVYHLPDWHKLTHPERLAVIRQVAESRGRDPRIARLAVDIIRRKAKPREYKKQAAALLKWIQDPNNFYYVNEPGERLQDPIYTLKVKHGDCDDAALLLASLMESLKIPWKLVISGRHVATRKKIRYIEGTRVPSGVKWSHIYVMVGAPAFTPTEWWFAEPTIQGVPLGWDIVDGDSKWLPEMGVHRGPTRINPSPPATLFTRPTTQFSPSPAYFAAMGVEPDQLGAPSALIGPAVAGATAATTDEEGLPSPKRVAISVLTGVGVAVGTQVTLMMLEKVFPNFFGKGKRK